MRELLQPIIQAYLTLWQVYREANARLAVLEIAGKSGALTNAILTRLAETSEENDRLLHRWRDQQTGLVAAQRTIDEQTKALEGTSGYSLLALPDFRIYIVQYFLLSRVEAHNLISVQEAELESSTAIIADLKTAATSKAEEVKIARLPVSGSSRSDNNRSERTRLRSPAESVSTSGERRPARSEGRHSASARDRADAHPRNGHESREQDRHRASTAGSKRSREDDEYERRQRRNERSARDAPRRELERERPSSEVRDDKASRTDRHDTRRDRDQTARARERSRSPAGRHRDRTIDKTAPEPATSVVSSSNGRDHHSRQSGETSITKSDRVEKKADSGNAKSSLVGRLGLPLANTESGQKGLSILGRGRKPAEISK